MTSPLVSLVTPVYNVAPYLPDFLASVDAQTCPLSSLDLVFVDDGSSDGSAELLEEWRRRTAVRSTLVTQSNAGLSAARNAGLAHATGEWVTFCDPDDTLAPDYLARVIAFLSSRRARRARLVCTNVLILDEATGQLLNRHPLRWRFAPGTHIVDLDHHPTYIHLQAASGFYRRAEIERRGLVFDARIVPNFEDGFFTAQYLADTPHPAVAFVSDAYYHYRRRADGGSLTQTSWARPEKYTALPRHGYLALARALADSGGHLPEWVQNLLLYDLFWYLKEDDRQHSPAAAVPPGVAAEFHDIVQELLGYIDEETIEGFSVVPTPLLYRRALTMGYKGLHQRPKQLYINRIDADKVIAQIRYLYAAELPEEEFRVRGRPVQPVHAKIRDISCLGRVLMHERIVWLPADGTIRIALDGNPMPLLMGPEPDPTFVVRPAQMWRRMTNRPPPARLQPAAPAGHITKTSALQVSSHPVPGPTMTRAHQVMRRLRTGARAVRAPSVPRRSSPGGSARQANRGGAVLRRVARLPVVARRYDRAWVFLDRDDQAQDNAEHLYRHVRANHPETNAWFVLRADSPDWPRLRREGFRLVRFGSWRHVLVLLNAAHVLSSQVDQYVVQPLDPARYGRKRWRYTFLQHGVTKDDLSRWVNTKPISLFVTATQREYDSIAGDHTPYVFTSKEVRLTGFPRHDRLLRLAADSPASKASVILVMPTWRNGLVEGSTRQGNARALAPGFWESTYAREWFGLLSSPLLREIAERHHLEVHFVPHPNLGAHLGTRSPVPDTVRVRRSSEVDLQELFARTAVLVTDYSSVAFEAAYLERCVVYFQFDQREFFGGSHVYRRGYWRYETDGFGPVTTTLGAALAAVGHAAAQKGMPTQPYAERMRATFPFKDGQCCERVYQEVTRLTRPVDYEAAYVPYRTTDSSPSPSAGTASLHPTDHGGSGVQGRREA